MEPEKVSGGGVGGGPLQGEGWVTRSRCWQRGRSCGQALYPGDPAGLGWASRGISGKGLVLAGSSRGVVFGGSQDP